MKSLPEINRRNDGFSFQVNGRPYIMLAAEVHNSACSSVEYMRIVWKKAEKLNCNTVLTPVYWELLEPEENQLDFSLVRQLISDAGKHHLKLVLLWFGSWKNGQSTYAPHWVKMDLDRFPRTEDEHGVRTKTLSMFGSGIFQAECRAFQKLLRFVKEFDGEKQTVIAVQAENEVGILGAARDFSKNATQEFHKNVPKQLTHYLKEATQNGRNDALYGDGASMEASWRNTFGEKADEVFMCWSYASYINRLAKCGRQCYALPMFTNVWLKASDDEKPGDYPCGGPVPEMLDVWKCAAPDLDALAPDIYSFQFEKNANLYHRQDNPLLIAETRRDKWAPANLYAAVGAYHALCYSPFGLESIGEKQSFITQIQHTDPNDKNVSGEMVREYLAASYRLLAHMMPILTECYGTDTMIGFVQHAGQMSHHITIGKYRMKIDFYHQIDDGNEFIPAAGIVIQKQEEEFIFLGYGYRAQLEPVNSNLEMDFLSLEKGSYDEKADWVKYMDLNGDEQRIQMEEKPTVLKALYYYF